MKHLALLLASSSALTAAELQLDFNAHLTATLGDAPGPEAELAGHAHDPRDSFTLQGLESNLSARYGEHLAGFIDYNAFLDADDRADGELEEAFLKLQQLPGGFELRAGRLLNRVTSQNSHHLHGWHFVDANLITSRFLGEEGLISNSAELSYKLPWEHDSMISVAFGDAIAHEHDEDGAAHMHAPGSVEGEAALLTDDILSVRLQGQYFFSDFHQINYGASWLHGKNGYGRTGNIAGADLGYQWRENGLEKGGKHLRLLLEPIYRDFDYIDETATVTGSSHEWGAHTSAAWGFIENWELGLRYDYLQGLNEPVEDIVKHQRASTALTRSISYSDTLSGHVRLQYNHDWREGHAEEDSVWLQFQIDFGPGNEIR